MTERVYAKAELIDDYLKRLVAQKIKQIDLGGEARVFQHPTLSNVVVKLFESPYGQVRWAQACIRNSTNPYLPKILSICKAKLRYDATSSKTISYYLVFSEKLTPLKNRVPLYKILGTYLGNWFCETDNPARDLRADSTARRLFGELKDRKLKLALELAIKKPSNCEFDLTTKNFMLRGSTLVLTDPWA